MQTLCQPVDGVCSQCGGEVPPKHFVNCPAKRPSRRAKPKPMPPQVPFIKSVGDFFSTVGVGHDQFTAAVVAPVPVGCGEKSRWLNDLGAALGVEDAAASYKKWSRRGHEAEKLVGLGDTVAEFLGSIGVTKERYAAAKAAIHLDPDCDCDLRQEWLNQVGKNLGIDKFATSLHIWWNSRARKNGRSSN